jgi:hypothetical protein
MKEDDQSRGFVFGWLTDLSRNVTQPIRRAALQPLIIERIGMHTVLHLGVWPMLVS